jgi:hypothetical protein
MGLFRKDGSGASPAIAKVVKAEALKRHKDETTWRFILLVRPDGATPFGAMIEEKLPNSVGTPDQWQRVPVVYNAASKERAGKETAIDRARLGSVDLADPIPTEVHIGGNLVTPGPKWIVPHECPNCGGLVDQAKEGNAAEPKCVFCGQPLPIQPAPAATGIPGFTVIRSDGGTSPA